MKTFAEHLQQFSRSIDLVNDDVLDKVRSLITQYLHDTLRIDYFEMMLEARVNGKLGLETFWTTGSHFSNELRNSGGDYHGQTAYAFAERVELWIVTDGGQPLVKSQNYLDLWNNRSLLPSYQNPTKIDQIKTSIILLLKDEGRVFGILDLESTTFIGISELAKTELKAIADSISILYQLWKLSKIQRECTQKALHQLDIMLKARKNQRLSKPKIFLACSSKADPAVKAALRSVLDSYSKQFEIIAWYEISKSGNINQQVINEILNSSYGVCYFSEQINETSSDKYQDNPNVLFEAGMLHVLSYADQVSSEGWLPIRENNSPKLPFDFAAERILIVPRLQNGLLNKPDFENELHNRLDGLLNSN